MLARKRSGVIEATAGDGNCRPITDAGSIAVRSSTPSWPSRASSSALIVGGIASSPWSSVRTQRPSRSSSALLSTSIDRICST